MKCSLFGNRPDVDKKPECDDCEDILRCSALTLRKILAVNKTQVNVDIIHEGMFENPLAEKKRGLVGETRGKEET